MDKPDNYVLQRNHSYKGNSRPLYLRYQTGQSEATSRGIGGYVGDQGFPQLNTSYNGLNQYHQGQGRRSESQQSSVVLLNNSWAAGQPLRGGRPGGGAHHQPPPHVSFNASSHQPPPLPPLINWRNSSTPSLQQLQVDVGPRLLPHEEHRQGRWSRRQDNESSRNRLLSINGNKENGAVHKSILSRQKSERSRSVESFIDGQVTESSILTASAPSAVVLAQPVPTEKKDIVPRIVTPPSGDDDHSPSRPEDVLPPGEFLSDEQPVSTADDAPPTVVEDDPNTVEELPQEVRNEEKSDGASTTPLPPLETDDAAPSSAHEEEDEQAAEDSELLDNATDTVPPPISTPAEYPVESLSDEQSAEEIVDVKPDDSDHRLEELDTSPDIPNHFEHDHSPPVSNHSDGKSVVSVGSEFGSVDSNQPNTDVESNDKPIDQPKRKITRPGDTRMRPKRFVGNEAKIENNIYPDNLSPFVQPKESLTKTFLQLENPEWEVIMQGLQGLVRLARHHSKMLQHMSTLHTAIVLLTKHVRNLRSQVARAACQAAQQMFTVLGRSLDSEVDDLAGGLLSRMADTNKFLRADAIAALDAMVKNVSPIKIASALVNKGAKHQNALVRGATSRLLLVLCNRLGPEKTLSLPKDTRDSIILTGAKMLQEGSLDTRRYAKEMFTLLSADSRLHLIMTNVIPGSIMRNIGKVIARINTK